MLKQRVLTASLLAPLVIWAVLALSTDVIAIILALFILIGSWEWSRLIGLQSFVARVGYSLLIAVLLLLANLLRTNYSGAVFVVLLLGAAWWLIGTLLVVSYKGQTGVSQKDTLIGMPVGAMVLIPCWLAMTHIHAFPDFGPKLMLFMMMLIWAADIGAYFAGRKFGTHKLAPLVSPGKTIEGVLGGLAGAAIFALMGSFFFDLPALGLLGFIALSVVVVLFSVVGDLLESLFKRRAGVKDSGQLLPGHGGVLDRIDSLTAAAPLFAFGLALFEGMK